jgi:hypothetical protein
MTIDIDWEEAFQNAKDIAIAMIIIACFIIAVLSVVQWFHVGVG